MCESLYEELSFIGEEAERCIPDEYYSCFCGFITNKNSKSMKARRLSLSTINWLRHLGNMKVDEPVLRAAVIVAEEFLYAHKQREGIKILHQELERVIKKYGIKENDDDMQKLLDYSHEKGHVHVPRTIKDRMQNHPMAVVGNDKAGLGAYNL